jgi:hypothetical protein
MQRQKLAYLTVRNLCRSWSLEQLLRPAANSNHPAGPQLVRMPVTEPTNA